nr:MAG TPA: hypothetical protein [Caudoviricetes sp.]
MRFQRIPSERYSISCRVYSISFLGSILNSCTRKTK